jgi:hypothetical protein
MIVNGRNLLVAVPAYNCEKQIARVMAQFLKFPLLGSSELLIIDNVSSDYTLEVACSFAITCPELKICVIKNSLNYGLGGTHKVAFKYCLENKLDGVVILHGDDQGNLLDFSSPLLNKNLYLDCILGGRFMKGSSLFGYSVFRIIGNKVFNFIHTVITGIPIYDLGSGLNFYSSELIRKNLHHKMPDDLTFNNAFLLAMIANKIRIGFYPISWREEDQVSNAKLFRQSLKILRYLLQFILKSNVNKGINCILEDENKYTYETIYPHNGSKK